MAITMEERRNHARAALDEYLSSKGEPCPIYDTDYQDTDASDLIADLLHLQKHLGYDVETTLMRAEMHYEAEQEDYAANGGSI
jgi:hypothetical protein